MKSSNVYLISFILLALYSFQTSAIIYTIYHNKKDNNDNTLTKLSRIIHTIIISENLNLFIEHQPFLPFKINKSSKVTKYKKNKMFDSHLLRYLLDEQFSETDIKDIYIEAYLTTNQSNSFFPISRFSTIIFIEHNDINFIIELPSASLLAGWLPRTLILYLISTILISTLCFWLFKLTTKPLHYLKDIAKRISEEKKFTPVYIEDKGELKQTFDAFNNMQKRIVELLDERKVMIAALSHDLKTILTRFSLRMDFIENTTQHKKALSDIDYMNRYLNQLALYTKSEETFSLEYSAIKPMEIIAHLSQQFSSENFSIKYQDNPIKIYTDQILFERISQNIISNASRFSSTLDIKLIEDDQFITISFSDNGCGISDDNKTRVFTPYFSINKARTRNSAGSGLGFMIIKNFCDMLNGKVTLRDNKPQGLVVSIHLPKNPTDYKAPGQS